MIQKIISENEMEHRMGSGEDAEENETEKVVDRDGSNSSRNRDEMPILVRLNSSHPCPNGES